ncbi:PREDICTED: malignant fibrous histiocytoma-amplified sequence 1 homolog [Branchiostoma belcheri]|uniref:Leucine-rich repeat protein SHOC-2 n=1 Tax=Branchiostoma belcheri TaxID=7741 RepID=A0A6P4YBF4_BRABE|nr:PREDICTED: malignant fibrous histiocytoma-amplified sequence 1 homolog [Branchiostoma belcheri]
MKLPQLEMLILSRNKKITLPDDMSGLINLTVLELKDCNLDTLEVPKHPNLQVLDLRNNMQISLPYDLYRLNNLKVLKLGGCNLDTVPPAVVRLNLLEELDLSGNRGIHLSDGLAGLTNLRVLKLSTTNMDTVPPVVWRLTQLEWLDLSWTQLQTLPAAIGQLTNVKHLDLSYCELRTLPPEVGGMTQLEWLDLRSNQLQTLPAEIGQLTNAKHLNLSGCKLRILPPEVGGLTQLKRLNLSNNKLQTLPAEVGKLSSACHLDVSGNPLTKPPSEVCRYGIAAISQYFAEIERSEEKISAHMKVVVLGEKMAGKTSLVRTLDRGESTLTKEEDRTHCVEITQWAPVDNITFEVHDFGGHDVYHLTHQFFLTPDAFYLLLVNLQTYRCSEERYTEAVGFWLDTLNARVPGAVVSIVGSKKDLCRLGEVKTKTKDVQARVSLQRERWEKEQRQIQSRLKSVEDIGQHHLRTLKPGLRIVGDALELCVSVKPKSRFNLSRSPRSWERFQDFLLETANNKKLFPTLTRILPRTWLEFEQLVRRQVSPETSERADKAGSSAVTSPREDHVTQDVQMSTRHWLTMTDCARLEQLVGLSLERLQSALSYLQQVGTILRYTDIPELKDYVFHDPPALIELFKNLFHHDTSALFLTPRLSQFTSTQLCTFQSDLCDCGLIQREVMACLLPPNVSPDIITALMQHFGLCFEVEAGDNRDPSKHTRQYKIPWYLHKQMPEELKSVWPDDVPEDQEQLQLMCNIRGFCPRGLFQRFSVGIHPLVKDRVDWKDGVMAYRQDYIVLVCSKPVADDTYITMATRGRLAQADEMWGVVHPLLEVLVQLLQEWPGVLYSLHVTCAHCIKAGLDRPYQHELRDRTAEDGRDVRCRRVKKTASTSADLVYRFSGTQGSAEAQSQQDVARCSQAEEEDVSRYFHYIKENVTAEWKDLAYQLGFSRPDIDNIDERNIDFKSRCRDTLEEWKEREGDAATITVLMDALRELELMSVVDGLRDKYPELAGATAGPTGLQ